MTLLASHLNALISSSTDDASEIDRRAIEEWTKCVRWYNGVTGH